jgi:signal transduction histidine kinase
LKVVDDPRADPLVALLVESSPESGELTAARLDTYATSASLRVLRVSSASAACDTLRNKTIDVVLLDGSSEEAWTLGILQAVRRAGPSVPVVVLGEADEPTAFEVLRAGAQDFVRKPLPDGAIFARILRSACEREHYLQAMLSQSQRAIAARDLAVGIISHDLRNPISTIQICAEALLDAEPPPRNGVSDVARIIRRSVDWMQQLLEDLADREALDTGRLALNRETMGVTDVLGTAQTLFKPVAEEQALEFVVDAAANLPAVHADPHRLLQVISNLLSNAMKFTPAGGRVVLSVQAAEDSNFTSGLEGGARGAIQFTVSDTGPGIPPEDLIHVFDWYWQSRHGERRGSGLGLAIARDLVEAHHGRLDVESTPGHGSRFSFTLPAATHWTENGDS